MGLAERIDAHLAWPSKPKGLFAAFNNPDGPPWLKQMVENFSLEKDFTPEEARFVLKGRLHHILLPRYRAACAAAAGATPAPGHIGGKATWRAAWCCFLRASRWTLTSDSEAMGNPYPKCLEPLALKSPSQGLASVR